MQRIVVLFSGGWDSAYCVAWLRRKYPQAHLTGVYFNYGQCNYEEEWWYAKRLAHSIGLHLEHVTIDALHVNERNVFADRNRLMIKTALWPLKPDAVALGITRVTPLFDKYEDTNYLWARRIAKQLGIRLLCPAVWRPKWWCKRVVQKQLGVTSQRIYSTKDYPYYDRTNA